MAHTPKKDEAQQVAINIDIAEEITTDEDGKKDQLQILMKEIQRVAIPAEENHGKIIITGEDEEENLPQIFVEEMPDRRDDDCSFPMSLKLKRKESQLPIIQAEENNGNVEDGEEKQLQIFMKKKLDEMPGEPFMDRSITIFRLPAWIHETNKFLCEPRVISIGPYHHGKDSLRAMEEHKWYMLRDFLERNKVGLEVCLLEMRALEEQARQCYSETVNLGTDDFVMMLLLDGCFILELFVKLEQSESNIVGNLGWNNLYSDLFLLENQIPFFVIKKLFFIRDKESHNCKGECPLVELYNFAKLFDSNTVMSPPQIKCQYIHHLLDLYYTTIMQDVPPKREQKNLVSDESHSCSHLFRWCKFGLESSNATSDVDEVVHNIQSKNILCISELHEAGVRFRQKRKPRDILDISFENGIMEIPFMEIDKSHYIILWNIVAFEQSQDGRLDQILSSYLALMDSLINTEKDVAILERGGIVDNYLENNEDIANIFNQFSNHFSLDYSDHYFGGLFKEIKAYSDSTWHKHRARLMHDYFNNPWSSISIAVAGSLLILTFIQTVYSAK